MTELIWDGKYDKTTGKKIAPPRIVLPFQTVETVNESAADRDRNLSLFGGQSTEWRNRLVWGDKKYVLPSLLPEFAGKVNLIYIDPPFDTGANFSYLATIPDAPERSASRIAHRASRIAQSDALALRSSGVLEPNGVLEPSDDLEADATAITGPKGAGISFVKEPSMIEQKAYRDTWGKGLDSYLKWFYETVVILRELLTEDGSIYVHIGPNMSHYAKLILDDVFGFDNYRNEIYWRRVFSHNDTKGRFGIVTDTVLYFSKSANSKFNLPTKQHSQKYIESHYTQSDRKGKYQLVSLTSPNPRPNLTYEYKGYQPPANGWSVSKQRMAELENEGLLHFPEDKTQRIRIKKYHDGTQSYIIPNVWDDLAPVNSQAKELTSYPTQKPEALLDRIIKASSNPGELVLDCFCGSGTTAAVAEKLGRRWITCDLGRFAIHTARKRFLAIENVKPFIVQNLGKYERQAWQKAEFGADADALTQSYREFILSLYKAQPLNGYVWLHGVKGGKLVHVGGVDAPVSVGDVAQVAAEFRRARGGGKDAPTQNTVEILGWDFAFEMNEVAKQQAALAGVDVRFVRIPREVLEKKAVEQGDIKFFELAALSVDCKVIGRGVRLELTDFIIPLDDVPQEIQSAITHWEQWIDYWAVDWNNQGDTFHNQWQDYRTRAKKTLQRHIVSPPGTYPEPGDYKIVVKVIDILGNDTTKTLKVTVS